jgi:hypothetical protein
VVPEAYRLLGESLFARWRISKKEIVMRTQRFGAFVIAMALSSGGLLLAQDATTATRTPSQPGKATKPAPNRPTTYGTSQVSYIEVPASAFLPYDSANQAYTSGNFGLGQRYNTSGSHDLVAPIHLPSGAKVIYLELDGHDGSTTEEMYGSFNECNYYALSCTQHPTAGASEGGDCTVPGFICSGVAAAPGDGEMINVDLTGDDIVVDNFLNSYSVLAEPHDHAGETAIGGMIVGYVLQVSAAPPVATFNDVPTTDGAFQFIEAFNKASITAGCQVSPPLYCPDSFVTRRQMAVFFAMALGLQWN